MISLADHDGKPFALEQQWAEHARTVLLPFRGRW